MTFSRWVDKYGDPAARGSWGGRKVPWSECCRSSIDAGPTDWLSHMEGRHPYSERSGARFLVNWYMLGTHQA